MKSINKKAEEYAKEFIEPFVLYYSQDEVKQFEAQHEDSFEAGANAVLEEIVAILPKTDKNLNDYGRALLWRLTEKIKELKGE